jgi:hypothetical protein
MNEVSVHMISIGQIILTHRNEKRGEKKSALLIPRSKIVDLIERRLQ